MRGHQVVEEAAREVSRGCAHGPDVHGGAAVGQRASRFGVQGSEFRIQGSEFRVQSSGFRVQGSGFRVQS